MFFAVVRDLFGVCNKCYALAVNVIIDSLILKSQNVTLNNAGFCIICMLSLIPTQEGEHISK